MGRIIEIQDVHIITNRIRCIKGDILSFSATGGQVLSGEYFVELLGYFIHAYFMKDEIIQPMGMPNTVMFLARRPGLAKIRIITGIQFSPSISKIIEVTVES